MKPRYQSENYPKQPVKGAGLENLLTEKVDALNTPEAKQESLDHLAGLLDGFLEKGESCPSVQDPEVSALRVSGLLLSAHEDEKGYRQYEGDINVRGTYDPRTNTRTYQVIARGDRDTELDMTARDGVVEKAELKDSSTKEWVEPSAFQTGALQRRFFSGSLSQLYPINYDTETTVRDSSRGVRIVKNTRLRRMGRIAKDVFWA